MDSVNNLHFTQTRDAKEQISNRASQIWKNNSSKSYNNDENTL
jgi:hypothetical protein